MDITRSVNRLNEFVNNKEDKNLRKIQKYEVLFDAAPEEIFPQLCPTREYDWIDGWVCDLTYTKSGYVEKDCIFTTPEENVLGPGLWIFTEWEPSSKVQIIRIIDNAIVIHLRINLTPHDNGTTTGVWEVQLTGINEKGNQMIRQMPDKDPMFDAAVNLGLSQFMKTGTLRPIER